MAKKLAWALACGALMMSDASALACKGSLTGIRTALSGDVTTLRNIEQEASDRLKGLDTRPFPVLRDEARKVAAIIGAPGVLEFEKELQRCRNRTYPIHTICAAAGTMLADILDKYAVTRKPDYDKTAYAQAAKDCEWLMQLKPLASAIRGTD